MKKKILAITGCLLLTAQCYASTVETDSLAAGRRGGAEIAVSAAASLAVNAGLTEVLKATVHEMRPDRSGNNSFPSRHTSWAFTASTVISNELYRHSPWWSVGAQTLASAVALQRVRSGRHYGSDVVSGAALGIASTELSYWIVGRIFRSGRSMPRYADDFRPSVSVASEAVYNLKGGACTGFGLALRGQLPLSERWGAVLSLHTASSPLKYDDGTARQMNCYGAVVGGVGHFNLPIDCLSVEPSLQCGAARVTAYGSASYGFEADFDLALNWRLTEKIAFRTSVGYRLLTEPSATSAITIGLSSVALF